MAPVSPEPLAESIVLSAPGVWNHQLISCGLRDFVLPAFSVRKGSHGKKEQHSTKMQALTHPILDTRISVRLFVRNAQTTPLDSETG